MEGEISGARARVGNRWFTVDSVLGDVAIVYGEDEVRRVYWLREIDEVDDGRK